MSTEYEKPRKKNKPAKLGKRVEAPQNDTQMRNAFIRVAKENMTGENKNIAVSYTKEQIKECLDLWAFETGLTYWFIEHNPDDEMDNPHFHIVIKFKTNSRFSTVKGKFPFGYIEPIKSTVSKTIQYLVHLNDLSKLQYSWDDVITNGGDLSPYKVRSRSQQSVMMESVYEKIESGEITELNIYEKISMSLYSENKTKIVNAFEHHKGKFFTNANRDIDVMFISGRTGKGKTTFAKMYCEKRNLTYCVSSSSNDPLQDYKGQDVLILDDMRDDSFKYHDFLKLLDNHTRSTARSRYNNKLFTGKIIIITSTRPVNDWYFSKTSEDKHQLYRRVTQWYKFDQERIFLFAYNEITYKYEPVCSAPIPVWEPAPVTDNATIDMFTGLGLASVPLTKAEIDFNEYASVHEANDEERAVRVAYEASLPPVDWGKVNLHRIG